MSNDDLWAEIPRLDGAQQRALDHAMGWVGGEVHGVGIGATVDGDPCVVVYARSRLSVEVRELPTECEGIPVRIEESGDFDAGL